MMDIIILGFKIFKTKIDNYSKDQYKKIKLTKYLNVRLIEYFYFFN